MSSENTMSAPPQMTKKTSGKERASSSSTQGKKRIKVAAWWGSNNSGKKNPVSRARGRKKGKIEMSEQDDWETYKNARKEEGRENAPRGGVGLPESGGGGDSDSQKCRLMGD